MCLKYQNMSKTYYITYFHLLDCIICVQNVSLYSLPCCVSAYNITNHQKYQGHLLVSVQPWSPVRLPYIKVMLFMSSSNPFFFTASLKCSFFFFTITQVVITDGKMSSQWIPPHPLLISPILCPHTPLSQIQLKFPNQRPFLWTVSWSLGSPSHMCLTPIQAQQQVCNQNLFLYLRMLFNLQL